MRIKDDYRLVPLQLRHVHELYKNIWSVGSITRPMGYAPFVSILQAYIRYVDIKLTKGLDYQVIIDKKGKVIGMFRFEKHTNFYVIGYGIVPEHRGKGLLDACLHNCRYWVVEPIYAIVYRWNEYSRRALERNGFTLQDENITEDKVCYCFKVKEPL